LRTTEKRIAKLTGIAEVKYDCCIKGCISYSLPKYAQLEQCPMKDCKHPRYRTSTERQEAYAQHTYIPVAHRLRLMYADRQRAKEMMDYRYRCLEDRKNNVRSDFWTG
ncbi:hypothetical protein FN846DRAFT_756438, partial [Sphaerosporella brunnea]